MKVPLVKPKPWVLPVTVVCFALGALIAFMINATTAAVSAPGNMRPEQLAVLYSTALTEKEDLQNALIELRSEHEKLRNDMLKAVTGSEAMEESFQKEINDLRMRVGSTPVTGPGIIITIDDTNVLKTNPVDVNANALLTHDVDLLMLVNELRVAGAEAMAINDQRIVAGSAIRCVGPSIQVNKSPVSAPFVVRAIGDPNNLAGAVNLPGGVLDTLRPLGIKVDVAKRDKLTVPAALVLPTLSYGKVVTEQESSKKAKTP